METQKPILRLTESALMLALSVILSLIKLTDLPFGGSVTLFSMLPVVIIAYRYGTSWGLLTGFVSGLLQMLLGMSNLKYGTTPLAVVAIILLDYIIAFGAQGLGGLFRKLPHQGIGLAIGGGLACVIRYLCHVLSGVTVWKDFAPEGMNLYAYSFGYNATYMVPETLITMLGALLISLVLDFRSKNITRPLRKG